MISCLTLEMSRTISLLRPSKMSSSMLLELVAHLAQHREATRRRSRRRPCRAGSPGPWRRSGRGTPRACGSARTGTRPAPSARWAASRRSRARRRCRARRRSAARRPCRTRGKCRTTNRYSSYSSTFGRWLREKTSSKSSGWNSGKCSSSQARSARARALDVDPPQAGGLDDLDARGLGLRRERDDRRRALARPCGGGAWAARAFVLSGSSVTDMVRLEMECTSCYRAGRHSWTHPEGWRDWPDETPATPVAAWTGRCQFLRDVWRVFPRPHGGRLEYDKGEPNGCSSAHLS